MNAPFQPDTLGLDQLAVGTKARVARRSTGRRSTRPKRCRLRHFGFDEGVTVEPLHLGPFGRDPIAIRVGRMTVAIRRKHAGAIQVAPAASMNPLPLVAVVGNPNAGKSALFNALTGARQKVGNYPGRDG